MILVCHDSKIKIYTFLLEKWRSPYGNFSQETNKYKTYYALKR